MTLEWTISHEDDLVWKVLGRYLRDQHKYDKWGAQGKFLLFQEVLREQGFSSEEMRELGAVTQRLVNSVFPRSVFPTQGKLDTPLMRRFISNYFYEMWHELLGEEENNEVVMATALEKTASKFGFSVEQAREIVRTTMGQDHFTLL